MPLRNAFGTLLVLVLTASSAHATPPAVVRVVLHPRASDTSPSTYVDIAIEGTEVPVRLVRRVAGACDREATVAPGVLVAVSCGASRDVVFDVTREGHELLVHRSGDASPADAPQIIARATLPAHTEVTVR